MKSLPSIFPLWNDYGFEICDPTFLLVGAGACRNQTVQQEIVLIHDHQAAIGMVKTDAGKQLVVSLYEDFNKEPSQYPANFWATVQTEEDTADTLLIALSYEAKP